MMNKKLALENAYPFFISLLGGNPVTLYSFKKGYEGDPLSPPEEEADQGEHPLDPPISPVSQENFSSTSDKLSHFFKVAPAERTKATIAIAQKSTRTIFP